MEAISEFERCKLTEAYLPEFSAPFVAESLVKIGLSHQESLCSFKRENSNFRRED